MAITDGYLTLEECLTWVGRNESRDTYELEDIVTSVSRMIDRYCGRHFYTVAADAREFDVDPDGYTVTFGPFNDLISVTSVTYDNNDDGTYESTLSASGYQLLAPVQGQAPGVWPYTQLRVTTSTLLPSPPTASGRERLIRITGNWGWPAVPPEVKQAARLLVAEMAKLQDAPLGVAGQSEFGVFRVSSYMPSRARQLLQPFRHPGNVGLA